VITFSDFDEFLVPLARRFHRSIANNQPAGEANISWSIGCGSDGVNREYYPGITMQRGWRTAVLHRHDHAKPEWIEDLDIAIAIVATGRLPE